MIHLVVDANVVVKRYRPEPMAYEAAAFFGAAQGREAVLHAPTLLVLEVASALWKQVRRAHVTAAEGGRILDAVSRAGLRYHGDVALASAAMQVAMDEGTSVYDGAYVALAEVVDGKLVTADRALMARRWSARRAGRVVWLGTWQAALPEAP